MRTKGPVRRTSVRLGQGWQASIIDRDVFSKKPFSRPSVSKPSRVHSSILPGKKEDITDPQSTFSVCSLHINIKNIMSQFRARLIKTKHLRSYLSVEPCQLKIQTFDGLTCITYYVQQSSKVPVLFPLQRMQRKSSPNIFSVWVLVQISKRIMAKPIPQTTNLLYWITRSLKQRHFKISNSKYGYIYAIRIPL